MSRPSSSLSKVPCPQTLYPEMALTQVQSKKFNAFYCVLVYVVCFLYISLCDLIILWCKHCHCYLCIVFIVASVWHDNRPSITTIRVFHNKIFYRCDYKLQQTSSYFFALSSPFHLSSPLLSFLLTSYLFIFVSCRISFLPLKLAGFPV